jgi:hypothetical protein
LRLTGVGDVTLQRATFSGVQSQASSGGAVLSVAGSGVVLLEHVHIASASATVATASTIGALVCLCVSSSLTSSVFVDDRFFLFVLD